MQNKLQKNALAYEKVNGKFKAVEDSFLKKWYQDTNKLLNKTEKEYNISLMKYKKLNSDAYKEYKKAIKEYNEKKIPIDILKDKEKDLSQKLKDSYDIFRTGKDLSKKKNMEVKARLNNKKLVTKFRKLGYKGVFEDNVEEFYKNMISELSNMLGITECEVEKMLFPTGYEEESFYTGQFNKNSEYDDYIEEREKSIKERINELPDIGKVFASDLISEFLDLSFNVNDLF